MRAPMNATRRRRAESMMLDRCEITRTTDGDPDPLGHQPTVTVYSGRCKVQSLDPQERLQESGEYDYTTERYRVDVPVGAYRPALGDVVTITSALMDPNLAGRAYRVRALLHKTLATAYRMAVTEGPA